VSNQITPKFTPKKHVVFCIGFECFSGAQMLTKPTREAIA
jgi:hypothetical protein